MDSSQRYLYFFSPTFAQSWWNHSRHYMHCIITQISSNLQIAKPARPTFCNAFCDAKLAHLSFTWNFILQLHFVTCPGGNVVAVSFSSLLHLGRYFFNVPVRICRIWIWALFSWPGLEEAAVWLFVTELVVPGLIADKNLVSMPRSHCLQISVDQLAKRSGESSYGAGYTCSMSVEFYKHFTYLNLRIFLTECCRTHLSHAWLKYTESGLRQSTSNGCKRCLMCAWRDSSITPFPLAKLTTWKFFFLYGCMPIQQK
jgi:hypothetical protein